MKTAAALALLLPAMGLSALALVSGPGCDCSDPSHAGEGWCAPASGACCPDQAKPFNYSCNVEVEGPQKAQFTTDPVTVCAADQNEAHVLASAQAQADHPDGIPRNAACAIQACPKTAGGP